MDGRMDGQMDGWHRGSLMQQDKQRDRNRLGKLVKPLNSGQEVGDNPLPPVQGTAWGG